LDNVLSKVKANAADLVQSPRRSLVWMPQNYIVSKAIQGVIMRVLVFVLALLALGAACAAVAAARPRGFRADMMARFAKAMPGARLTADPDQPLTILFKRADGTEGAFNLDTLVGYCRAASAADCAASKADFVMKMSRPHPDPTPASLRLVVRDRAYLDYIDAYGAKSPEKGEVAKYRPIGDDLYAVLAADGEDTVALIGDVALRKLGLTPDQAWALAEAQTRAILPPLPKPAALRKAAVSYPEQHHLASLLIDLPAWEKLAARVGPTLFMTVVADHIVFVGQVPDGPALEDLKQAVVDDCAAQERCISPHLYRFRDGRWVIAK